MSHQQNIAIAQKLLERIGGSQDPAEIAALFDADLVFEIQGDDGVLPWIGRKTGRQAIADFIRDIRALTEPVAAIAAGVVISFVVAPPALALASAAAFAISELSDFAVYTPLVRRGFALAVVLSCVAGAAIDSAAFTTSIVTE